MASSNHKPLTAFILAIASGISIVLSSLLWCLWLTTPLEDGVDGGMMLGWEERMYGWDLGGFALALGLTGIVFGMMNLASAIMLYVNPEQNELWGSLIIVSSVLSVPSCMGGFGVILGVISGCWP